MGGRSRITIRSRSRRWYGDAIKGGHRPADFHPAAAEWDAPARHRQLLEDLVRDYDGWAIATTPDGLGAYGPLPVGCEVPNGFAGSKPAAWTLWVLDALGYDPHADTVDDLFPGSGAVSAVLDNLSISGASMASAASAALGSDGSTHHQLKEPN